VIEVQALSKTYRVHKRPAGFWPAVRSLLHRQYEPVQALDGVSFTIAPGERVGFLGPNGAGKTTTLKILSGLLYPTSGQAKVAGFEPRQRSPEFLRTITLVMGQKQQLLWDLPPVETYAMNRALYDIPRADADATLKELIDLLEIGPLVGKPTRQLSLGERMKCELAAALLHRPKVLFLDEPTIGLDVAMQARMRQFIKDYNERHGASVILTSHYMEDVAALCPRIIVIDKGHLVYDGDLRGLARRIKPEKRITIRLARPEDAAALAAATTVGAAKVIRQTDTEAVLAVTADKLNESLRQLLSALPATDLSVEDPPLEEVMREVFQQGRQTAGSSATTAAAEALPEASREVQP
jgi:ABC-2 type transport system ATP-binding protein